MGKRQIIELLDQAQLDILDAKDLMDDNRHFHLAGELLACSEIMGKVIRATQQEY
jgi:hypothetical protein